MIFNESEQVEQDKQVKSISFYIGDKWGSPVIPVHPVHLQGKRRICTTSISNGNSNISEGLYTHHEPKRFAQSTNHKTHRNLNHKSRNSLRTGNHLQSTKNSNEFITSFTPCYWHHSPSYSVSRVFGERMFTW